MTIIINTIDDTVYVNESEPVALSKKWLAGADGDSNG